MEGSGTVGRRLLPEVEGLRAIAVLAVLLYHAHLGFSGGYVGVDVFFVVSGFLITGLMLREYETTGRVSLGQFYARRARRLLPAATLVLLTTVILARFLLDTLGAHRSAVDALYAAGFVSNFHFAAQGADYFHRGAGLSTLQHWWSLAVEEQFYLAWPITLVTTWRLSRRFRHRISASTAALLVTGAIAVAGFVAGLRLTTTNPSWAYFATWSRGWELALGASAALWWHRQDRLIASPLRARIAGVGGWLGLAAIAWGIFRFDSRTPFPGTAALVPVLGTLAVIVSIGTAWGPARILSVRPLQWIGGRSYGIYLWHWPLLVLLEARVTAPSAPVRAVTLLVSVAAAAITYVIVENPVRHQRRLVTSSFASLTVGGVLVGATFVVGGVIARDTGTVRSHTGYVAAPLTTPTVSPMTSPTAASAADPSGGPSTTITKPSTNELATRVHEELQPIIERSVLNETLPDNLNPALADVPGDHVHAMDYGCLASEAATTNPTCEFGDPTGTTSIAVFGDSHSIEWFPALEILGHQRGWKVYAFTKRGCPAVMVSVRNSTGSIYGTCNTWRKHIVQRLLDEHVNLVITTNFSGYYGNADHRITPDVWRQGLVDTFSPLIAAGSRVLVISDTPTMGGGPTSCLEWNRHHISKCSVPRPQSDFTNVERSSAAAIGYSFYDSTDWLCASMCPLVIGNIAVYYDLYHVTKTYGEFLTPYVDLLVSRVLAS